MQTYISPAHGAGIGEVRVIASSETWIEGAAIQQLHKTAALPGMRLAVGLPDLHPGKGSPIGAAFLSEGWLYPALVGNDIGCGIGLWRTGLPAGKKSKAAQWADRLRQLDGPWLDGSSSEWLAARGVPESGHEALLGTIGSGNHFAELQIIESILAPAALALDPGAVYLCVHSGSRGFGEQILRDHATAHGMAGLASGSPEANAYLARHEHARAWAAANRELIAARLVDCLQTDGQQLADICHNAVEAQTFRGAPGWLHRKGAAPADQGPVVIAGSRGSFSYLVQPREPQEGSAFSLAHGAGRKWSRSDCRARLEQRYSAQSLTRTDLGSHVVCEDKNLLYEEAPQAYKNISTVINDLVHAGLAEVIAILRPLVTYKVRR